MYGKDGPANNRDAALRELESLGFSGTELLLIDLVPAVAMCWADGEVQPEEEDVLIEIANACVDEVNRLANYRAVTRKDAYRFIARLLSDRDVIESMRRIIELIPVFCLSSSDPEQNRARALRIWGACVKAGAAAPDPSCPDGTRLFSTEEDALLEFVDRSLSEAPPPLKRAS